MKLLIYYSYNHKCFKSKFDYGYKFKIGTINGFGEELVSIVPLNSPRLKQGPKAHLIIFLEKVINRLKYGKKPKTKTVYIEKTRFPWWK